MPLRFSVIVTNYNYCQYVCDAVESILNQTVAAYEIIVVDDGSTDGSAELLKLRFGDNPSVRLVLQSNEGQVGAFISGAQLVSGDVICFLDSDDSWNPGYLQALSDIYITNPSVDFIFCNMRYIDGRAGTHHSITQDRDHGVSALRTYFCYSGWPFSPTSALSLRSPWCERVLALATKMVPEWRFGLDEFLVRGTSVFGAHHYYLGEPLVNYRMHASNNWLGRERSLSKIIQDDLKLRGLVDFIGREAGMNVRSQVLAAWEFKTKPQPTGPELRDYLRLAWGAPTPLSVRLQQVASVSRHFLRSRQQQRSTPIGGVPGGYRKRLK